MSDLFPMSGLLQNHRPPIFLSSVFWGEQFEFSSIPEVEDITVHVYKDSDKKKKKDKDYMGLVNLSVRSLVNQQCLEKW